FAKRGIFPANMRNIFNSNFFKPENQRILIAHIALTIEQMRKLSTMEKLSLREQIMLPYSLQNLICESSIIFSRSALWGRFKDRFSKYGSFRDADIASYFCLQK